MFVCSKRPVISFDEHRVAFWWIWNALMIHGTSRCRCLHIFHHDSAWETFILKHIWSFGLYPDSLSLSSSSSSNTRSAAVVARYCGPGSVAVDGPEMAEYSQTGILTALLLFTVVTLRDIYVGRNSMTQQDSAGPDILTQRPNKHTFYTGPVLKFQFWWESPQTFMLFNVFTVCLQPTGYAKLIRLT